MPKKTICIFLCLILCISAFASCNQPGLKGDQGEQGPKGDKGDTGTGIIGIQLTDSRDNLDTYTILLSNGSTQTFQVRNGKDGVAVTDFKLYHDETDGDYCLVSLSDGRLITIPIIKGIDGNTPSIGEDGNWYLGDQNTGVQAAGPVGPRGAAGKSAYELYVEKYNYVGTEEEWLEEFYPEKEKPATDIYRTTVDGVVTIYNYDDENEVNCSGTGFFIDREGTILTAYHIIEEAYSLSVLTFGGGLYQVTQVVGFDMDRDLALLKTNYKPDGDCLNLNTGERTPGETVYALGSSLGFLDGSFSSGIVSAQPRRQTIDEEAEIDMQYIQFTAPISPGNSGGPLLNSKGEAIGVVVAHYERGNNLNLAVDMSELKYVDRSYCKSVSSFYRDTVFFKIHFGDHIVTEKENNSTMASSNLFQNGTTMRGSTTLEDLDYYKLVISGKEKVRLYIIVYYTGSGIYQPVVYSHTLDDWMDIGWTNSSIQYTDLSNSHIGAFIDLDPGTYYVQTHGTNSNTTVYYLFMYYDAISNIHYPVDMESCYG